MTSQYTRAQEFWGHLIRHDKSPSPRLEQLLLGLAHYINRHIAPWDVRCLTPVKLAAFYRITGGNYDLLFIESHRSSLSFVYRSLGCFHTFQPENDAFVAPTLPALTPHGFVRWQTIQLLLDPGEHVPILQEAVKRFDIINPGEGGSFPRFLPKEALPSKPDEAILLWHDNSLASLREVSQLQKPSLNRQGRDPVDDVASITDSSADTHSIVDAADYFDAEEQSTSSTRPPRIEFPPPMLEQKKARSKRGLDYYHSSNRPNKASSEGSTQPDSDSDVQTPNDTNSQPYKPGRSRRQLLQPDTLGCDTMTAQPVQRLNRRTTHRDADNARAEMPPKEPELSPTLDGRGRRHSANNLYDATLGHGSRWEDGANGLSPQFYAASRPKSKDGYFPEMSQQQRPRPVWKDVLHQPTGSGSGTVSPKRHQSVQFVEADQARRKETDRHDRW